jgi:hypothetical protein
MKNSIIQKTFRELYGQPCWGIDYSKFLNLWINFGEPRLYVREPYQTKRKTKVALDMASRRVARPRGEWRLWIYCSNWRLSKNGDSLAFSSSSYKRIQLAINKLNGERLVSVQINPKTGLTRFSFDLGCFLECRRFEKETDDALWVLYKPSGYTLSVHGNGTYCHQRASERQELLHRIKIQDVMSI